VLPAFPMENHVKRETPCSASLRPPPWSTGSWAARRAFSWFPAIRFAAGILARERVRKVVAETTHWAKDGERPLEVVERP